MITDIPLPQNAARHNLSNVIEDGNLENDGIPLPENEMS